jgi:hypothetical protein
MSNVQFNLKFCTSFGESLKIIGSGASLGECATRRSGYFMNQ